MKNQRHTFLICSMLALNLVLFNGDLLSQITINSDDYPSQIGTYIVTEDDTADVVHVNVGLPGENQIWYIQQEIPGILTRQLVVDKANTPYLADFPDANLVTRYAGELGFLVHSYYFDDVDGLFYSYQKINADSLIIAGIGVDSSQAEYEDVYLNFKGPVDLEPDLLQFAFPLVYEKWWETASHSTVEVDTMLYGIWTNLRTEVRDSIYNVVDGWGTVVLPQASFACLRVKSFILLSEMMYTNGVLFRERHTRTINYTWVTEESGIVARIMSHSDEPDENFTEAKQISRLHMFNPSVNVSLADTIAAPGESVIMPVRVSSMTDLDIVKAQMDVSFEKGIIQSLEIVTEGTLTALWQSPMLSGTSSGVTVSLHGDAPLTGQGILFYLKLVVAEGAGDLAQTAIGIDNLLVEHDGPVFTIQPGRLTVAHTYDISGAVKYYSGDSPIDRSTVYLNEKSTVTGADGGYEFSVLPRGNYSLKPMKDGDLKNSISAFDASLILRANVGAVDLLPYQKIAADVSGNGSVTAYDASMILRYSVGLISEFTVGDDWRFVPSDFAIDQTNWNATPRQIDYSPLAETKIAQNFTGIVYGDVSGTWSANGAKMNALYRPYTGIGSLRFGELTESKDKITVPLVITSDCEILAASFEIRTPGQPLEFANLALNAETPAMLMEFSETDGVIQVALASPEKMNEIENLLSLEFVKKHETPGHVPEVKITNILLNGGLVQTQHSDELSLSDQTQPLKFELLQNYPNPFNSSTCIRYSLQDRRYVRISIFNALGQTISVMDEGYQNAGTHEVRWAGKNSRGNDVPSGIYFYELESFGADREIRKMVLIR
ncbi:MAG: FlgD immunoglobulin-like domain containing protein [Candidatus Zhuqueibacterota bacterium]